MKSIKSKILLAFTLLLLLNVLILVIGFGQFKKIAHRLNTIEMIFIPLSSQIASLANFSHLNENLNREIIDRYKTDSHFVDNIRSIQPRLFENKIRNQIFFIEQTIGNKNLNKSDWTQVLDLLNQLSKDNQSLIKAIEGIIQQNQTESEDQTLALKESVRNNIRLLSSRLNIIMKVNLNKAIQDQQRAVYMSTGLAVLTLIIAIIIGLIAIKTLTPLSRLQLLAKQIAAGDLSKRVNIKTGNEIESLANEINTMADAIEKRDFVLQEQQKQLIDTQKLAVIGQMVSKINHEIKNPLNALNLNLELLQDENLSQKARQALSTMFKQIERLSKAAEGYLNIAKKPQEQFKQIDIDELISNVEQLFKPQLIQKNIRFEKHLQTRPCIVFAHPSWMEQVLINLMRNAIEAVCENGTIDINVNQENGKTTLIIKDNGPGIDPNIKEQLFEPFCTTKTKGTGLGLAITKEMVTNMGGTITVSSTHQGSMFNIEL